MSRQRPIANQPAPAKVREAAARVGEKLSVARLHPQALVWLEGKVAASEPWAIAVSGGGDSVALLFLLWAHFPAKRKKLAVVHFDHATRPDSAEDAGFVEKLARELGVKFLTARRGPGGLPTEAALREARWKFFREQLAALGGRIIFFGHQRDDVAESMLMRLARGSGAGGLAAPRPVREFDDGVVALRPLLDLEHQELCLALRAAGVDWREDSTNASDKHLRNRVRNQVLPAWSEAVGGRNLSAGVARSRALLEEDDDALENLAAKFFPEGKDHSPLKTASLDGQPKAVWRRVLRRWLNAAGVGENLNAQAFDALLEAAFRQQPGRWSAGPGRWLEFNHGELSATQPGISEETAWPARMFKPGEIVSLQGGRGLRSRVVEVDRALLAKLKKGRVDPARTAFLALPANGQDLAFQVRPWQPGDRYRPLGAPGTRKLQDLFTDKKVPPRERRRLPVVCTKEHQLLWVPGLPPAHTHRVDAKSRLAMELTYLPNAERIEPLTV